MFFKNAIRAELIVRDMYIDGKPDDIVVIITACNAE